MKQYIPCRIAALQDKLRERGLDAALIYDRENLIYFAGISDLEGGVLCVPSDGTAELFCLWMEAEHMRRESGLKVTGYLFPADTQSTMAAKWLHKLGLERPRVGFTRSAISVTEIAGKAVHKERIIGTHFWNPAYLVPLVEVIRTKYVSEETVAAVFQLMEEAGKKPVLVKKDVPGFLANRMQHALFREAISIVENGIAEAGDVDDAIKYGFGMRLGVSGPMEVIDRGGLDLTYSIHKYLFPHIESSAEPSKLMVQLMDEGKLGFKTGEGFQLWSPGQVKASNETLTRGLIQVSRALGRL